MRRLVVTGRLPVFAVALAAVIAALTAPPIAARTGPVVTEADFLSVLDSDHPAVIERARAVALARAEVTSAASFANPELGIVREDPDGDPGSSEQVDWTVSWRLPSRARGLEIRSAEHGVKAAEARLVDELLALRLAMREDYAAWAVATARRDRLAAHAERIEALAARERNRAEKGESSGLEAHRLELAAAGLRARWSLAGAAAERARAAVRAWQPDLPPEATPALPPLPPIPTLDGDHPRWRALRAELAAAELTRKAAGRFLRSPEVVAGWQRQEAGPAVFEGPILGLAWPLPVFRRNQAEKARADAHIARLEAQAERLRREVEAERAGTLAAYHGLKDALADARGALADSDRMLLGAVTAFRHGEATLTDLLETQRSVAEAELTVLDLHQAVLAAHRDLERVAGRPVDRLDPSIHPTTRGDSP